MKHDLRVCESSESETTPSRANFKGTKESLCIGAERDSRDSQTRKPHGSFQAKSAAEAHGGTSRENRRGSWRGPVRSTNAKGRTPLGSGRTGGGGGVRAYDAAASGAWIGRQARSGPPWATLCGLVYRGTPVPSHSPRAADWRPVVLPLRWRGDRAGWAGFWNRRDARISRPAIAAGRDVDAGDRRFEPESMFGIRAAELARRQGCSQRIP